jgi:hypothetical protein
MLSFQGALGFTMVSAIALAACTDAGVTRKADGAGALQAHASLPSEARLVGAAGSAGSLAHVRAESPLAAAGAAAPNHAGLPSDAQDEATDGGAMLPPTDASSEADDAGVDASHALVAPRPIVRLTASDFQTCAVLSDQRVLCWGVNPSDSNQISVERKRPTAEWVSWLAGANELSAGRAHNCFLTAGGQPKCYGINYYGELGDGTKDSSARPVSVAFSEQTRAVAFALGEQFSCALIHDGTVQCWGGWTGANVLPRLVAGLHDVVAISGQGHQSCALLTDRTVRCWTDYSAEPVPTAIAELTGAVQLDVGPNHGCAVLASHELKCWTDGLARSVTGLNDVVSVAAAGFSTCAALGDGSVRCWGNNNYYGELGNGSDSAVSEPSPVPGVTDVKQLAAGFGHYCALRGDDSVQCWGFGADGELGNGKLGNSNRAVNVLFPVEQRAR